MRRNNSIIILAFITLWCRPLHSFLWIPNRYTAPFWAGDTHITNHFIDSWDLYLGGSYGTEQENRYTSIDTILSWYQTITAGFFCEATMPITTIKVKNPESPLQALENGVCYENCTVLLGWGINHDTLPILDFIDFMVRAGIATPAHVPILPAMRLETLYGYADWGFPVTCDLAAGLCNWMTFGLHTMVCQFHTDPLVWHIQPYCKADHFLIGLSLWFGYSYTGAQQDTGSRLLFPDAANWHMHTLHYGFEYEFIQSYFPLHPRLGIYYNQHVGGENSLHRSNYGVTVGLDISW